MASRRCTSGRTRTALSRRGCMMGWGARQGCGTANFGRHDRWPQGVPARCAIIHVIAHLMRIEHGTWRRLMKARAVAAARARSIDASERPLPALTHESRYRRPRAQRYNGWAPSVLSRKEVSKVGRVFSRLMGCEAGIGLALVRYEQISGAMRRWPRGVPVGRCAIIHAIVVMNIQRGTPDANRTWDLAQIDEGCAR